jgi:hypothetical protein
MEANDHAAGQVDPGSADYEPLETVLLPPLAIPTLQVENAERRERYFALPGRRPVHAQ